MSLLYSGIPYSYGGNNYDSDIPEIFSMTHISLFSQTNLREFEQYKVYRLRFATLLMFKVTCVKRLNTI